MQNKPPVPKFNLNYCLPQSEEEVTKEIIILQKADKRRQREVVAQIEHQVLKLNLNLSDHPYRSDRVLKKAISMLTPEVIDGLKSKKYSSIACALVIQAMRHEFIGFTNRQILTELEVHEKQVRKILMFLEKQFPIDRDQYILKYVQSMTTQLKFTEKFYKFAELTYLLLKKYSLIQGEHEHVISATLIKFTGDVVFANRGGINCLPIIELAGCCEISLKTFLRKIQPFAGLITEELYEQLQHDTA